MTVETSILWILIRQNDADPQHWLKGLIYSKQGLNVKPGYILLLENAVLYFSVARAKQFNNSVLW